MAYQTFSISRILFVDGSSDLLYLSNPTPKGCLRTNAGTLYNTACLLRPSYTTEFRLLQAAARYQVPEALIVVVVVPDELLVADFWRVSCPPLEVSLPDPDGPLPLLAGWVPHHAKARVSENRLGQSQQGRAPGCV